MEKIYPQMWAELPHDVRTRLTEVFGIIRTGISEVRDQTLISDGTTQEDLKAISTEKMAEYVESDPSETSYHRLWELTLAKVKYELHPPTVVIGKPVLEEIKEESNAKTTTKKSK